MSEFYKMETTRLKTGNWQCELFKVVEVDKKEKYVSEGVIVASSYPELQLKQGQRGFLTKIQNNEI